MDYSTSAQDDPAGASPWGSSPVASPQHARSGSYGTSSEAPPSPSPFSPARNTSYSQDSDTMGGGSYNRPASSAGGSVTESDDQRPDTAESVSIDPEQALAGHQQQQQAAAAHPQRYHGVRGQQQQASQYRLQAKITGLERTGRKDPILRFDVHVSGHKEHRGGGQSLIV